MLPPCLPIRGVSRADEIPPSLDGRRPVHLFPLIATSGPVSFPLIYRHTAPAGAPWMEPGPADQAPVPPLGPKKRHKNSAVIRPMSCLGRSSPEGSGASRAAAGPLLAAPFLPPPSVLPGPDRATRVPSAVPPRRTLTPPPPPPKQSPSRTETHAACPPCRSKA